MKRVLSINPLNKPPTKEQLATHYLYQMNRPLKMSYGIVDCDDVSIQALRRQVDLAIQLQSSLDWKMHDNTYVTLSENEAKIFCDEVEIKKALRERVLFKRYQVAKSDISNITLINIQTDEFWKEDN